MTSRARGPRKSAKHKRYERAIAALDKAYTALGALIDTETSGDDSRVRLRSDINEYADYLSRVTWWRDPEHPKE